MKETKSIHILEAETREFGHFFLKKWLQMIVIDQYMYNIILVELYWEFSFFPQEE